MQRGWVVSPDYRAAIEALKAIRVGSGVTQREMARRLGKHPSFVNKIEQLERRLDLLEFMAFAEALALTPSAVLAIVRAKLPAKITI